MPESGVAIGDLDPLLPLRTLAWLLLLVAVRHDAEHAELPDGATLPALLLAMVAALAGEGARIAAALTVAGGLVLIGRLAALAVRRGGDTRLRETPFSFDSVLLGFTAAILAGLFIGVALGLFQALLSGLRRRPLRLPEPAMLLLGAAALALPGALSNALAGLQAAGLLALLGAGAAHLSWATSAGEEPIALGFGDVKLAAALALLLPPESVAAWLGFSLLVALIDGGVRWLRSGTALVPLGPALYLAAVAVALSTAAAGT